MLLVAALSGAAVYGFIRSQGDTPPAPAPAASPARVCEIAATRLDRGGLTRPIMYAERSCEAPRLDGLRDSLRAEVARAVAAGRISAASVYLRDMNSGDWTVVNDPEEFTPGPMRLVSLLVTYLRVAQKDPTSLEHTFPLSSLPAADKDVASSSTKTLEHPADQAYTVRELLEMGVRNGDQRAQQTLLDHVDTTMLRATIMDLRGHDGSDPDVRRPVTARRYSTAIKCLYDGALLNSERAEYALSLLKLTGSRTGIAAGAPANVNVVCRRDETQNEHSIELHECGLFYLGGTPYMLTVLSRGNDLNAQRDLEQRLSTMAYAFMAKGQGA